VFCNQHDKSAKQTFKRHAEVVRKELKNNRSMDEEMKEEQKEESSENGSQSDVGEQGDSDCYNFDACTDADFLVMIDAHSKSQGRSLRQE